MIRPPSEAGSILLQVTVGCPHNACTFCGAYKQQRFRIKSADVIAQDLRYAAMRFKNQRRLFLCDGDALTLKHELLAQLLAQIRCELPWVTRVGSYASARSIAGKTEEQLSELRELGLATLHMGLESGDDVTLARVRKGVTSDEIVASGRRARVCGMKVFVTVILGLAGAARSSIHAALTAQALSTMDPDYVGALSLMLVPGTPLHERWKRAEFLLPDERQLLSELRVMIDATTMTGLFYANHASNYLPLRVRLPRHKASALALIDRALAGGVALRPEWLRGL
jgi:radical SAM superfamily enzyme YgiQ (UPF0313 family)